MTFYIKDSTKALKTLKPHDRIDEIDGEVLPMYFTEIAPEAATRTAKRLIEPSVIKISPFVSVGANGAPTFGTPYYADADVIFREIKRYDSRTGANTTVSRGTLTFLRPRGAHKSKILVGFFHDRLDGLMFANQFTVTFVSVTYPDADWRGNRGTPTTASTSLNCDAIELRDGFVTEDGVVLKNGGAMIKVSRDQITRDQITQFDSYFTIRLNTDDAVVYRVWNTGDEKGVCVEGTHFFNIYLTRGVD